VRGVRQRRSGGAAAAPRTRKPSTPDRLGEWSIGLADAFTRLVGLLDEPEHAATLGPLYARETVLRLLQTDQAPRVLAAVESEERVPLLPRLPRRLWAIAGTRRRPSAQGATHAATDLSRERPTPPSLATAIFRHRQRSEHA
jgi:hypothetical protein